MSLFDALAVAFLLVISNSRRDLGERFCKRCALAFLMFPKWSGVIVFYVVEYWMLVVMRLMHRRHTDLVLRSSISEK